MFYSYKILNEYQNNNLCILTHQLFLTINFSPVYGPYVSWNSYPYPLPASFPEAKATIDHEVNNVFNCSTIYLPS